MRATYRENDNLPGQIAAVVLVVLFILAAFYAFHNSSLTQPVPEQGTIQEDDPRWDCETMGNKICGSDLAPEAVAAVEPHLDSRGCLQADGLDGDEWCFETAG